MGAMMPFVDPSGRAPLVAIWVAAAVMGKVMPPLWQYCPISLFT
jgi:hypothetical protein